MAIAAKLAEVFDREILNKNVRPNNIGEYCFGTLKSRLLTILGTKYITQSTRRHLRKCGYRLRIKGNEVEVIRFS
jgi:hypothetical protein